MHALALLIAWALYLGNIALLCWLWVADHNLPAHRTGDLLARLAALAGLVGGYLAFVQVILLTRLPPLERVAGFDRLTRWHRWNGYLCIGFVIAHVILQVQGYGMSRHRSFFEQFWDMVANGLLVGMVTATIGTALLLIVVGTSIAIVRRRLPYELWFAVHLTAYAGIALAWFHEIPTGNDLGPQITFNPWAPHYWRWLAIVTLAAVAYRVIAPFVSALRHRLRIAEVIPEGPGVTSLRITGRKLDTFKPVPGQFFLWRFLARGHWWTSRPFSLSEAPNGRSFRITAKAVGDHTAAIPRIPVGTRVITEGPFGDFTERARRHEKVLLVAGGIGITPVRALLERMDGDVVAIYRVIDASDVVFADELARLERDRGIVLHYVIGDHATPEGGDLLSPEHLDELVPDLSERDVYVCGPPAMTSVTTRRLRAAGVHRRHMHVERFAL